tara:strand:+ start:79 stop:282 length:204 start_codon:yes stop_codon:yes gene_type:complete
MITEYKIEQKVNPTTKIRPTQRRHVGTITFSKVGDRARILLPDECEYFMEFDELKRVVEAMTNELSA